MLAFLLALVSSIAIPPKPAKYVTDNAHVVVQFLGFELELRWRRRRLRWWRVERLVVISRAR